jgi:nitrogen fixation protein FixH
MKMGWGVRITILYCCFVVMMVALVIASSRQHFDLVSANYYTDEIAYQKVIDAGKNQATLSSPVMVHADETAVTIDFPAELKGKSVSGVIQFYSPVNAEWDQKFDLNTAGNSMNIRRSKLRKTRYTIKIDITSGGKKYYQESDINLNS